jgi:hypothetical protein
MVHAFFLLFFIYFFWSKLVEIGRNYSKTAGAPFPSEHIEWQAVPVETGEKWPKPQFARFMALSFPFRECSNKR